MDNLTNTQSTFNRRTDLTATDQASDAIDRLSSEGKENADPYIVQGDVVEPDATPVSAEVRVFQRGLRQETLLGQSTTDTTGSYSVTYTPPDNRRGFKLVVRAVDPNGTELVKARITNVQPIETIQLVVGGEYRGLSEYQILAEKLIPLLQVENVQASDLTSEEVVYLEEAHDLDSAHLAFYVQAASLSRKTRLLAPLLYGLFRQGFTTPTALIAPEKAELQRALEDALAANIIPIRWRDRITQSLDSLQTVIARQIVQEEEQSDRISLCDLLGTCQADSSEQLQESFLTTYIKHRGSSQDLWNTLRQKPEFQSPDLVEELQFSLALGALTQNDLPLVRELQQRRRQNGTLRKPQNLVQLDTAAWQELISQSIPNRNNPDTESSNGFPSWVKGDNEAEKIQDYARKLEQKIEESFPTAKIAYEIRQNESVPEQVRTDLVSFFDSNPDFDFHKTSVDAYFRQQDDTAFTRISDRAQLTQQLKGMQRLLNITPRYSQIKPLIADGIYSAQRISRMGRNQFIKKYSNSLGGQQQAKRMYAKAERRSATAMALVTKFAPSLNAINTYVTPSHPETLGDIPDWPTLFGALDFCACKHCRSVYSPAAYLVDLLEFLKNESTEINSRTAKDILFDRRPDIGQLELSCDNTNTPLPYIDLVNEVLENAVSPSTAISAESRQTRGTAEELRAIPEYVNSEAYEALAQESYPWHLPFDLWTEEARVYLAQLGVSRAQLMETFQNDATPSGTPIPEDIDIATDALGLTVVERQIITGVASQQPWEYWGYAADQNWVQDLSRVSTFLKRSELTYADLLQLLSSQFINASQIIRIEPEDQDEPASCDLTKLTLTNLTSERLDRLHRFAHLWQKLDWTIFELDKMITAFQPTPALANLDNAFLINLHHVQKLQTSFKVPLIEMLSWWAPIDTVTYEPKGLAQIPSLYNERFQNKTIYPDPENDVNTFRLTNLNGNISDHSPALLAALRISAEDLSLLIETEVADNQLNLENLSQLFRVISFAKALRLKIADFLKAKALIGIDPLNPATTYETLQFISKVQKNQSSTFDIAGLDYLLRHHIEDASGSQTDESIIDSVEAFREGLWTIIDETTFMPDSEGELTKKNLTSLLPSDQIGKAVEVITGPTTEAEAIATEEERTAFISTYFSTFLDPTEAEAELLPFVPEQKAQRFNYVLTNLLTHLRQVRSEVFVQQTAGELLKLDPEIIHLLLGSLSTDSQSAALLRGRIDDTQPAITDFLALANPSLSARYFDNADLAGTPTELLDAAIDFDWGTTFPEPANGASAFSAEWNGTLWIPKTGNYTFYTFTSGGVRLSIDNQLLTDEWSDQTEGIEHSTTLELQGGRFYVLSMAYYNSTDSAIAQLQWSSSSLTKAVIPRNQFHAPTLFEAFEQAYLLTHKAAVLINGFQITPLELDYLASHSTDFSGVDPLNPDDETQFVPFDLNTLPLDTTEFTPAHFHLWERLYDLFTLRDSLPTAEDVTLIDLFRLATELDNQGNAQLTDFVNNPIVTRLADITDWDIANLAELLDLDSFTLTYADFNNELKLPKIQACLGLSQRLGASISQIFTWISGALEQADSAQKEAIAQDIKNTLRAKYNDQQWFAVATPLKDKLREQQRTALIAYLLVHPENLGLSNLKDSNELYEHFLIDVEMSACQLTSRLKLVLSSIQLFVQRCLMGLEADTALDEDAAKQWKWMKNYRVWEANRKVFLYPENWIEPELRDDKSPFFKELENELLQSEVNLESAETAFRNYLEKLDGVARLDARGMYHQLDTNDQGDIDTNILHVFARTFGGNPRLHYYRQRIDGAYWTAWEKIDADIQGNHLIPAIFERRLRLFWPVFAEKALEADPPTENQGGSRPKKYWEIQIAWSEYKHGKWSATTVAPDPLRTTPRRNNLSKQDYTFLSVDPTPFGEGYNFSILCFEKPNILNQSAAASFVFTGCHGEVLAFPELIKYTQIPTSNWWDMLVRPPLRSRHKNMIFQEESNTNSDNLSLFVFTKYQALLIAIILRKTPGRFGLLYPHHFGLAELFLFLLIDNYVESELFGFPEDKHAPPLHQILQSFFYRDQNRTFIVTPNIKESEITPSNPVGLVGGGIDQWLSSQANGTLPDVSRLPSRLSNSSERVNRFNLATPERTNATSGNFQLEINDNSDLLRFSDDFAIEEPQLSGYDVKYLFETFYHPYVCDFIKQLNRYGVDGFFDPDHPSKLRRQLVKNEYFESTYDPNENSVLTPYPIDDVDFSQNGAYALYNWELFFHAPLMIADRLTKNQRFEEAQQWFHYIFDPTLGVDAEAGDIGFKRFWKIRPFYENQAVKLQIQDLLLLLSYEGNDETLQQERENLVTSIERWRKDPFKPHLVARLRTSAYQKTVVMKYLDNLIAWGDQLFRRDSIESINEATQLYILVAQILGPRPQSIPPLATVPVKTYNELEPELDDFSNALIQIENLLPPDDLAIAPTNNVEPQVTLPASFYFCIPKNDKLLGYWDTIADRLFKIRNCMNIEGVVRQLPLFQPPIDPGLLVKAAAAGVDIGSAIAGLNAPRPYYRFQVMAQKATELCNDLKSLGSALLSALEKRDSEALSLLRSSHEIKLLNAVRQVREQQITEAEETVNGLAESRNVTEARRNYYRDIEKINDGEKAQIALVAIAGILEAVGQGLQIGASAVNVAPELYVGAAGYAGTPLVFSHITGGSKVASGIQAASGAIQLLAGLADRGASIAATVSSYQRRWDDWKLQEDLASKELDQIDRQIAAAEIRTAIAEKELENHDLQVENAKEVDAYMQDKYTNRELYDWMISQISSIYFQSYQLAYDVAKRAERCYQFELGLGDSNFIQFGYWDSLKKGLLAGEKLHYDLKRMEAAYLEEHKREYEITKHISLAILDPVALLQLRETGQCFVNIPEVLFDLDFAGHYMRWIKSVSLTIPCVTGPYVSINCTLTLLKNSLRVSPNLNAGTYARDTENDDLRFLDNVGAIQSIATSSAQNDSGLFELNFRDERYLPFEGAGAISQWRLELPNEFRQFDYNTITDVILHMNYMARQGGGALKAAATDHMTSVIEDATLGTPLMRMFSAKQEFSSEWYQFLNPEIESALPTLEMTLNKDRFPFYFRDKNIEISAIDLYLKLKEGENSNALPEIRLTSPEGVIAGDNQAFVEDITIGLPQLAITAIHEISDPSTWLLEATAGSIVAIDDMFIVCHYTVS